MKSRDGVVLVIALLCILALEVTGVGLHYITLQEVRTARSATTDTRLRLGAQSAAARVLARWPGDIVRSLALHASASVPDGDASFDGITTSATIERIDSTVFLVHGMARSPLGERADIGALAVVSNPASLVAGLAAVSSEGDVITTGGGRVIGPMRKAASSDPVLATLSFDRIAAIVKSAGDSSMLFLHGPVTLDSIPAVRVMVVDGDIYVRHGSFAGIFIVRGNVSLMDGTTLDGSLIVRNGTLTLDGATVRFDPAACLAAASSPRLTGPYRGKGRTWIPIF